MKTTSRWMILSLALAAAPLGVAMAQAEAPAVRQAPGGISYISGGAGEEARTAMAAHAAEFPLKIVLSGSGGAYVVADSMRFSTAQGDALIVRDAGPVLMVKLPAGAYTVETTAQGVVQRHAVTVGAAAQTLNWRFPG